MSETATSIAVIYYSKSGHSLRAARKVAEALKADLYPLRTRRYGMPFLGYLRAGLDSLRQVDPPLIDPLPDISGRDVVVICGPIWTSYPAAPLRSFFEQTSGLPEKTALLLTCGDHSPPEKAFAMAEEDVGQSFIAKVAIPNSLESEQEGQTRIDYFVTKILTAAGAPLHEVAS